MLSNQPSTAMTNPYNILWPYYNNNNNNNNIPGVVYPNADISLFQAAISNQISPTACNDVTNTLTSGSIIASMALQQHQQHQLQYYHHHHHHQQQQHQLVLVHPPSIKLPHPPPTTLSHKLGFELGSNNNSLENPNVRPPNSFIDSEDESTNQINQDTVNAKTSNNNINNATNNNNINNTTTTNNINNTTTNINNNINNTNNTNNSSECPSTKPTPKSKTGRSFTIDFLLSNGDNSSRRHDEDDVDNSDDDSSPSTPGRDLSPHRLYSPITRLTAADTPTKGAQTCNPQTRMAGLPIMHSTPNSLHSDKSRFPRRHELCHPYFHQKLELFSQNVQTYQPLQHTRPLPDHHHHNNNNNHHHHQQQLQQPLHRHPHQQQQQNHPPPNPGLPFPVHQHHHDQTASPRCSIVSSASTHSSSSTFSSSSSSSESMTSPRIDGSKEGKMSNKIKRIRTIFTPDQLERLEAEFERQQYMVGTERFYLSTSLNLTEAQVKVWFQNRRIKWRKQHLEQQQARLAQGDLYRDLDDSEDESEPEHDAEAMTSTTSTTSVSYMTSSSGPLEGEDSLIGLKHEDDSLPGDV